MRMELKRLSAGIAGALAFAALGASAGAAMSETLTVTGHRVHQTTMTGEASGDFAGEWAAANGVEIEWLTFNVAAAHDRLYREASLSSTTVDIGFAANRFFTPAFDEMFEPLDDYLAANPIESFEEFPQGMLDAMTIDGKLYGIPFRHATAALPYQHRDPGGARCRDPHDLRRGSRSGAGADLHPG